VGEKIKKVFAVLGAVFTVIFCTLFLVLRRRDSDRQRSGGTVEYDTTVEDGITECEGRVTEIEGHISNAEDGVARCEERLHRAEEILRNAIRRSREGKTNPETVDSDNCVE
jgi:hypothetical protein